MTEEELVKKTLELADAPDSSPEFVRLGKIIRALIDMTAEVEEIEKTQGQEAAMEYMNKELESQGLR
jgi:hypothetical protein